MGRSELGDGGADDDRFARGSSPRDERQRARALGSSPSSAWSGRLARPCHRAGSARRRRPPRREPAPATSAVKSDSAMFRTTSSLKRRVWWPFVSHWTPRRWTRTKPSPARSRRRKTAPPPPCSSPPRLVRGGGAEHARASRSAPGSSRGCGPRWLSRIPRARARSASCPSTGSRRRPLRSWRSRRRRRTRTTPRMVTRAAGAKPLSLEDAVLLRALRWFKREFFTWCDKPACKTCGFKDVRHEGMGETTAEERAHDAGGSRRTGARCARR